MQWIQELIQNHPDLVKFISIPVTCAFVGWITNYIAVKMIFHLKNFGELESLDGKVLSPTML